MSQIWTNLTLISLLIFYNTLLSYSQDKRDYQWLLGVDQDPSPTFRALKFDFNKKPFNPTIRNEGLGFGRNNSSLCDKNGSLLFYSNGCAISNREHQIMPNGNGMNDGEFFQDFWFNGSCLFGYPGRQDILILEDPKLNNGYYVIHKRLERETQSEFKVLNISYSYVDLEMDNGLGDVVAKNVDFYGIESFLWSYLTGINHTNGKDWWVLNPASDNNFYVFYIDENGIELSSIQDAQFEFDPVNASAGGDAKFSPNGEMLAYFNQTDGLLLYDFDRESGNLSNFRKLESYVPESVNFATCEWSPNSEYIYLATSDSLWQVEVDYENLEDGKVFIAKHNEVNDPLSTQFFMSALGPDCRIYIRPGSSSRSFHVIHYPDRKGQACDLEQQGIKLPEITGAGSFPNFPRFRVDEEEKCDSDIVNVLGEPVYWKKELKIFPNPSNSFIRLDIDHVISGEVYIVNMSGQVVFHSENFKSNNDIDISRLPSGKYSIEYIPKDNMERVVCSSSFIKVD